MEQLIAYCEEQGVVREEHSLRQKLLKRHNLQFYGLVTEQDFHAHLTDIENAMKTLHATHDTHQSIAHQLVEAGAVDTLRKANLTMSYFSLWQHGTHLRDVLSERQFYEHKGRYLKKMRTSKHVQYQVKTVSHLERFTNKLLMPIWAENFLFK